MFRASCLCEAIVFEVTGPVTDIYQCHCSVCRKAFSGSGASACLCAGRDFKWLKGEALVTCYVSASGYRSVFCKNCGSHVPDSDPEKASYWIPAGLLPADQIDIKIGAHVYCDSKAPWDQIADDGVQYAEGFTQ